MPRYVSMESGSLPPVRQQGLQRESAHDRGLVLERPLLGRSDDDLAPEPPPEEFTSARGGPAVVW